MAERPTSPLRWLRDVLVYAPMGLAGVAVEELPRVIARGRERADRQLATAQVVGRFAVAQGQREARRLMAVATGGQGGAASPSPPPGGRSPGGLGGPGVPAPPASPIPPSPPVPPTEPSPAPAPPAPPVSPVPPTPSGPSGPPAPGGGPAPEPGSPSEGLAIPGYDALSASQVVARLPGLTGAELEAVRAHEASNRGRRTILNRVSQLEAET